jgi:hypothetical protein
MMFTIESAKSYVLSLLSQLMRQKDQANYLSKKKKKRVSKIMQNNNSTSTAIVLSST